MLQELQLNQRTFDESQLSKESDMPLLSKIAILYADVFADPPWNEFKVCDNDHYTSKANGNLELCAGCKEPLRPAYPETEVIEKIFSAVINKRGACLTIFEDARANPLAAGWGFACSNQELQNFYRSEEMKSLVGKKIAPYLQEDKIFYISEIFVATAAQKRGFGTQIAQTLVDRACQLKLNIAIRTHKDSPMARIAGQKLGMARIVNEGEDCDYEGRILFAK